MSDENSNSDVLSARPAPIVIHAQYIKDLSFENPNAPDTLKGGKAGPEMDININMSAREVEENGIEDLYEVTLMMGATAKKEDKTYFIAEIQYAALCSLKGAPENQHHPMLFIEVPRMMFPFARQILSDITANGGYPPLLLNPVDFQGMYMERFAKELEASKKNGAAHA